MASADLFYDTKKKPFLAHLLNDRFFFFTFRFCYILLYYYSIQGSLIVGVRVAWIRILIRLYAF